MLPPRASAANAAGLDPLPSVPPPNPAPSLLPPSALLPPLLLHRLSPTRDGYQGPLTATATAASPDGDPLLPEGTTLVLPLLAVPGLCPAPGPGAAFPVRPATPADAAALAAALAAPPPATGLVAVYAAAGSASGRGLDGGDSSSGGEGEEGEEGGEAAATTPSRFLPTPGRLGAGGRPALAWPFVGVTASVVALAPSPPGRRPGGSGRPGADAAPPSSPFPAAALLIPRQRLALVSPAPLPPGGAAGARPTTPGGGSPRPPPAAALCVVLAPGDARVDATALAGGAAAPGWVWRSLDGRAALGEARAALARAAGAVVAGGGGGGGGGGEDAAAAAARAALLARAAAALASAAGSGPAAAADALQAALPLASGDAAALTALPAAAPRLRRLAAAAAAAATPGAGAPPLACRTCGAVWATTADAAPPPSPPPGGGEEGGGGGGGGGVRGGVSSTHANVFGHVHPITTLRDAACLGAALVCEDAPPTPEGSWFPGYAWTIAYCGGCASHAGWRFDEVPVAGGGGGGGAPAAPAAGRRFWGVRRAALANCVPAARGGAAGAHGGPTADTAAPRPRVRRSLGLGMAV